MPTAYLNFVNSSSSAADFVLGVNCLNMLIWKISALIVMCSVYIMQAGLRIWCHSWKGIHQKSKRLLGFSVVYPIKSYLISNALTHKLLLLLFVSMEVVILGKKEEKEHKKRKKNIIGKCNRTAEKTVILA